MPVHRLLGPVAKVTEMYGTDDGDEDCLVERTEHGQDAGGGSGVPMRPVLNRQSISRKPCGLDETTANACAAD